MTHRRKSLNIANSDRSWNCSLIHIELLRKAIPVTTLNEAEITAELEALRDRSKGLTIRNDKEYLIFHGAYDNDYLINLLFDHAKHVTYHTNTQVPYHAMRKMASKSHVEVVYSCKSKFLKPDIDNVIQTFTATQVTIDVPIVYPDVNPYDLFFILYPLRYNIDKLQLSFPGLKKEELGNRDKKSYYIQNDLYYLKPEVRYIYMDAIRSTVAKWKMNLFVVCHSDNDIRDMTALIQHRGGYKLSEGDIYV